MDEKFQRPHSDEGPDLVRLMLAPSRRMEAITNLPPRSDQMLGTTSMGVGLLDIHDGLHADGGVFVDGDVVHREAGAFEEIEVDFADFDAPAESAPRARSGGGGRTGRR